MGNGMPKTQITRGNAIILHFFAECYLKTILYHIMVWLVITNGWRIVWNFERSTTSGCKQIGVNIWVWCKDSIPLFLFSLYRYQERSVKKIVLHPGFKEESLHNNFAVLFLDREVFSLRCLIISVLSIYLNLV